jgi:hypothetical protein
MLEKDFVGTDPIVTFSNTGSHMMFSPSVDIAEVYNMYDFDKHKEFISECSNKISNNYGFIVPADDYFIWIHTDNSVSIIDILNDNIEKWHDNIKIPNDYKLINVDNDIMTFITKNDKQEQFRIDFNNHYIRIC